MILGPAVNMLFFDNAAPDSWCAERLSIYPHIHVWYQPQLRFKRKRADKQTNRQTDQPTRAHKSHSLSQLYNNPSLCMVTGGTAALINSYFHSLTCSSVLTFKRVFIYNTVFLAVHTFALCDVVCCTTNCANCNTQKSGWKNSGRIHLSR